MELYLFVDFIIIFATEESVLFTFKRFFMKKVFSLHILVFTLSLHQTAVAEIPYLKSLVYSNINASPDKNAGINGQQATTYISSVIGTSSHHVVGVPTNTANIILIREYLKVLPDEIQEEIQQAGNTIINNTEIKLTHLDQQLRSEIFQSANSVSYNTGLKLNQLDRKLDKSIAMQSALSGLFQPYNVGKFNLTAAIGGYKSQNAIAVGTGYRFNNNVAAKMGVSVIKGNSAAYNAGVNLEW